MSEKISQTAEGKESTLGSAIFKAFSDAGEKLLPMYKNVISELTSTIEGIEWSEVGNKIKSVINTFLTKEGRAELLSVATDAWSRFGAVAGAAMTDLGNWLAWGGKFIGAALVESFIRGSDWFAIKIGENFDAIWEKGKTILAGGLEFALAGIVDFLVNSIRTLFLSFLAALNAALIPLVQKLSWVFGGGSEEDESKEYQRVKGTYGGRYTYFMEKLGENLPKSNLTSKTVVGVVGDAYSRDLETQKKLLAMKGKTSVADIASSMAGPMPETKTGAALSGWLTNLQDDFGKATGAGTDEIKRLLNEKLGSAQSDIGKDEAVAAANAYLAEQKKILKEQQRTNNLLAQIAKDRENDARRGLLDFDVPQIAEGF
jgi:hypothetical protein